jgi:hypothetical protein
MVLPLAPGGADAPLRITPGMEVYDASDHKLGTVAHIHEDPAGGDVVELKTGLFGLGRHLYVPRHAVRDVTEGGVFLTVTREEIDRNGWDRRPEAIDVHAPAAEELAAAQEPEAPATQATWATWATWEAAEPGYRARCQQRYGEDAHWETYAARYRFAWETGQVPGLGGRPWDEVQSDLRARWEVLHPDVEWQTAAETVRDAWTHGPGTGSFPTRGAA